MKWSDLDRRVQFRRAGLADDGYQQVQGWADLGAPIWAARRDVSDGEKAPADTVYAEISARFTVRSDSFTRGITPKDEMVSDGLQWRIVGIKELGRHDWIEITATARLDLT